ncbi:hypothetical protein GWI33_002037 [Rhynchophorus ferrugineus]|uniref:Uncharacterized protein n=1 Tax=Rhynchophorus ferrugineus TaxID=354439 RepID=A0A834J371_RHYFE|nr:hypothetical protein GWI33_002037 [Rhynchophorus ferrugineus]
MNGVLSSSQFGGRSRRVRRVFASPFRTSMTSNRLHTQSGGRHGTGTSSRHSRHPQCPCSVILCDHNGQLGLPRTQCIVPPRPGSQRDFVVAFNIPGSTVSSPWLFPRACFGVGMRRPFEKWQNNYDLTGRKQNDVDGVLFRVVWRDKRAAKQSNVRSDAAVVLSG